MRNVTRPEKPTILARYEKRWTKQLLEAIEREKKTGERVSETVWKRYGAEEIRERLKEMFAGLCCYCESRVGDVAFVNIEHRKPKRVFPELTFDWANLYLACPKCNIAKGHKWDSVNEILDAVVDVPISDHLTFRTISVGLLRHAVTNRGATTIIHADLNRDELQTARLEVFLSTWHTVCEIKTLEQEEGDSPRLKIAKENVRRLFATEHGSVIRYVTEEVLGSV